jgi:mannosidase alpha-like ER degradation enhancer 2
MGRGRSVCKPRPRKRARRSRPLQGAPWRRYNRSMIKLSAGPVLAAAVLLAACSSSEPPASAPEATRRLVHALPGLGTDSVFAAEVREAFEHAWGGYVTHAWGHDALRPLSGSARDWYDASLLMTPIDAYDTMRLMGLDAQADSARALVFERLSFDHDMTVQVFEVTIRILGGLLSAYQMDGDPRWLDLATDLGNRLLPAFDSPTGMPWVRVNLATGAVEEPRNNPAEIGTLTLEMGQLSRLTGDPKYFDAAKRGVTSVFERRSSIGLVGTVIDVQTGAWASDDSHVGGRIDSYYEYLLKSWLLFGDLDLRRMWNVSHAAINDHLADVVNDHLWYGRANMNTGVRTATRFGALEAFLPAVLALSGDLERAARLEESVALMFTTFGVEPESFDYTTMEILSPGYPLRPEAIESAYYLFVLTGDERWREMGKDFFHRIVAATRVDDGFAHLADVRTGVLDDAMESFFLAETLKYAWLLAVPSALDFDAVVFNTEAHPLRPVE